MSEDTPAAPAPTPAEARASAARARLTATLAMLQARLSPKALALEALNSALDKGREAAQTSVETVKRHPVAFSAMIAAIGVFLARRPIVRAISRLRHATPPNLASLEQKRADRAPARKHE